MSKTPVMVLQEYMAKQRSLPVYDLIESQTGALGNSFTYRVTCNDFTAKGTASNKKQAKHLAATEMLILLEKSSGLGSNSLCKMPDTAETSEQTRVTKDVVADFLTTGGFINYVGKLHECCAKYVLQEPQYDIVADSGPAHQKTFKMKCVIGSLEATASSFTKKQAKQEVSKLILEKLIKTYNLQDSSIEPSEYIPISKDRTELELSLNVLKISNSSKSAADVELAVDRYRKLVPKLQKSCPNDMLVEFYHLYFRDKYMVSETAKYNLKCMYNEIKYNAFATSKAAELISSIFGTLDSINMKNPKFFVFAYHLHTTPPICEIGVGKTIVEAQLQAIMRTLETILVMIV